MRPRDGGDIALKQGRAVGFDRVTSCLVAVGMGGLASLPTAERVRHDVGVEWPWARHNETIRTVEHEQDGDDGRLSNRKDRRAPAIPQLRVVEQLCEQSWESWSMSCDSKER